VHCVELRVHDEPPMDAMLRSGSRLLGSREPGISLSPSSAIGPVFHIG
jgi:hypothetical protein